MALVNNLLDGPRSSTVQTGVNDDTRNNGPIFLQRLLATRTTRTVIFILAFILLVAAAMIVHEFGHLVAARACKVPASELGLGLGPKLLSFRIGKVRFSLRAIPVASFVRLDSTILKQRPIFEQLAVHLGGITFNLVAGLLTYGTIFSWLNFLLAAGNILPLYQHDGWKCGVVLMRAWLQKKSQPAEWAFTFSGGFVSLVIAWVVARAFM